MRIVAYPPDSADEWLIDSAILSRFSQRNRAQVLELLAEGEKKNKLPILLWDRLLREKEREQICGQVDDLIIASGIERLRVYDLGAAYYLRTKYPSLHLQLILEAGQTNINAINLLIAKLRLERVVFATTPPLTELATYIGKLTVPLEIMLKGRVQLAATARQLISWQGFKAGELLLESAVEPDQKIIVREEGEESYLFHSHELDLSDQLDNFKKMGLLYARIDGRFPRYSDQKLIIPETSVQQMSYLKNPFLQSTDDYLGEVVEAKREQYLGIWIKNGELQDGELIRITTPQGKKLTVKAKIRRRFDRIVAIDYVRGVSVKSLVQTALL